ncbi:MAG: ABC transporter ATP-binding protein [Bacteroidales bacterium]|nr:ABC transporter ATP-binding protein [Bacteroidales bacterium]
MATNATNAFLQNKLRPYRGQMLVYFVLVVFSVVFTLTTILSITDFLKILFPPENGTPTETDPNQLNRLLNTLYSWLIGFGQHKAVLLFALILCSQYLLKNIFSYFAIVRICNIRNYVVRDIRNCLYSKITKLPLAYFSTSRKGDVLSRFSNDISEFDQNVLLSIQQIVIAVVTIILYLVMLFYINIKLTFFALLLLPIIGFVISRITRHLRRSSQTLQEKTSYLTSLTEETISGVRIIKSFTAIDFSNERFRRFNNSYTRLRNKIYRRIDLASPVSDFLGNSMVIVILVFGAYLVFSHDAGLTPELFITYIMLFVLMINPAKDFATAISQMKKGTACTQRLSDFLDIEETVAEAKNPLTFDGLNNSIVFNDLGFEYSAGNEVLSHINLTIQRGETVAIVGPSGSGKSTLADLIPRFHDCTTGKLLIDDTDIRQYSIQQLRSHIGIVSQDTILFNDTVFGNIAFGSENATKQQVEAAAKIANAHDFIMRLDKGYQTNIGDCGDRLSGGQRQRICIARAILSNPDILILDEATSALDTESERLVQDALNHVLKNRTAIVIAHRLSTIADADKIVVLDHGQIVETGNHQQLMALNGLYKKLVDMQSFR